jgi:geranylgeranyl diphosphate synthase type II
MNKKIFNLSGYLKDHQEMINKNLKRILAPFEQNRDLIRAMDHSLMAGGKRLRPILSMAAAQACGKDFSPALPACCSIEMIHTYSLIHDDLPAMDDDDLRRGLPTCHKKFSEATAILAGDALLTHAFYILARPEDLFEKYPDPGARLSLISKISAAVGIDGMVEGQMLDMLSYQPEQDDRLNHLKKIHGLKTGKLITVSVESGALSVGADLKITEQLTAYADNVGLAFQVVDDILNIEGDPQIMGKSAGSDVLNEKMTFPAILGMDASKKYANKLIDTAIDAISQLGTNATPLRAIARYILDRDH